MKRAALSVHQLDLIDVLLAVLVAVLMFLAGLARPEGASAEALVSEGAARELLANTTVGRQAVVGSVWWPPVPALLRLPVAAFTGRTLLPVGSLGLSCAFAGAVLVLLDRVLRRWHAGWERLLIVAGLGVNPVFLGSCLDGSPAALVMFLCMLAAFGLAQWSCTRQVRYLVMLSSSAALLLLTDVETAPWLAILFAVVVFDVLLRRGGGVHRREAELLLLLVPPLYAAGVWLLMNWLIMGDGLYFLRSLRMLELRWTPPAAWSELELTPADLTPAAVAAVAFAAAVLKRNRVASLLALVAFLPVLLTVVLQSAGLGWTVRRLAVVGYPLSFMAVGHVAGELARRPLPPRAAVALVPLLAAALAALYPPGPAPKVTGADTLSQVSACRGEWLPRIERHVLSRSRHSTVFVCGYDSFPLLQGREESIFVPSLDFDFERARRDYHGRRLYLLVHVPVGRRGCESLHWKYRDIFWKGAGNALFDGDWGYWRLFELVLPPHG